MLPLFSILFLFIGHTLASKSANQYVDTVLHTSLQKIIQDVKLEPASLPDYTFEYIDQTTFFGNVSGKVEYSEGKLVGLSKIQRISDCEGPKNVSGKTYINCTLTLSNLTTSYKGKLKYGILPRVPIHGKGVALQNITLNVSLAYSSSERIPLVKSFTFERFGLNTTFTGLGLLDSHMKVLEEGYKRNVTTAVTNVINDELRLAIALAFTSVPMPLR